MGKVVKLDSAAPTTKRRAGRRGARRRSRTALVLGGGGFTGAVYEIGALRALNLLSDNRTVNQFDVYVGTSAGAFVAALVANGVAPEELMRVVNQQSPAPFRDIDLGQLLRPNLGEQLRRVAGLPIHAVRLLRELSPGLGQRSIVDLVLGLAGALPSGLYSGDGIEAYLREVLAGAGRSDDFRALKRDLYLVAADLDTCERVVFGADGWDDVPISTAVRASTALPMVYRPVVVRDRHLVDGGVVSTTNLDLAVEAGARLIVVINPLVPFVNDFSAQVRTWRGRRPQHVSDMGLPRIGYQTFKLMAYQRLHEMAKQWEARYPGVDIVLIEPEPDDRLMFETSMLNFTKRVEIARHGFESVAAKLAGDYEKMQEVCARHGIEITPERLRDVMARAAGEPERSAAWRRILEQTTGTLLRQSGSPSP